MGSSLRSGFKNFQAQSSASFYQVCAHSNENPSVGLILCADKDDAVVEYALRRSISPALVANYQLYLPNKKLLKDKLRELAEMVEVQNEDDSDE